MRGWTGLMANKINGGRKKDKGARNEKRSGRKETRERDKGEKGRLNIGEGGEQVMIDGTKDRRKGGDFPLPLPLINQM